MDFPSKIIGIIERQIKASIMGVNSSKNGLLVTMAMLKWKTARVAPPKYLFMFPLRLKYRYTLIEQSEHLILLKNNY